MMEILGILSFVAFVLFMIALFCPNAAFFNKLPVINSKGKSGRRWICFGVWICVNLIGALTVPNNNTNAQSKDSESVQIQKKNTTKREHQFVTIKTADDAVLTRYKNLYNKLQSFKNSPDFHAYGFGKGGNYYGWYMAARNFTEEENLHLVQTYGFVSEDLLMLGQEYLKSKGKETDYSRSKREEFENVFSSKTWEVLK